MWYNNKSMYLQMYAHASAESMTEGIVLHSGRPAADNYTLTFIHLHHIIRQSLLLITSLRHVSTTTTETSTRLQRVSSQRQAQDVIITHKAQTSISVLYFNSFMDIHWWNSPTFPAKEEKFSPKLYMTKTNLTTCEQNGTNYVLKGFRAPVKYVKAK